MRKIVPGIAKAFIRFYQLAISPLTGPNCRFHPSCSAYALEAIDRHGALKGGFLALKRITKCHPFHKQGFSDPVPTHFTWAFAWGRLFRYKRGQDETP